MRNFRERFFVVFLGTIALLVLLEINLRIVGVIYHRKAEIDNKQSYPPNAYVILCLGNSFTYGLGAPRAESYPAQLQHLFEANPKGKNVIVVNQGMIARNSGEILSSLRYNIDRIKPQLIILQTGSPNLWNSVKYGEYLRRKNNNPNFWEALKYSFSDYLHQLRVYKLASLLYLNARNCFVAQGKNIRIKDGNIGYRNSTSYKQAVALSENLLFNFYNKNKKDIPIANGQSSILTCGPKPPLDENNPQHVEQAVLILKEAVKYDPYYPQNYRYLGDIFLSQERFDEALRWYIQGIKANPDEEENTNYVHIKILYTLLNKTMNRKLAEFIADFRRSNAAAAKKMFNLSKREALDWVESDIREIVKICRQKNITIILQNYPSFVKDTIGYWKDYIDALNERLRENAYNLNIPFVDNEAIFMGLLKKEGRGNYFNDEFLIYGHCNSKGYKIIAENVYRVILRNKILE